MNFTQSQITEILDEIANGKNGYQQLLQLSLESIMRAERNEFNAEHSDSSNGYRFSSVLGHGGKLELAIPRSRHHNFYPMILALIKDQNEESKNLAYELYSSGLTTLQIGSLFDKIYGHHYSKSSISNMMLEAKADMNAWLTRDLEKRYPIIYIDATYWHTRRIDEVSSEAYYTILAVKEDRTREVLSIVNHPNEGANNWKEAFEALKQRGLETINLFVCDGLQGIENIIAEVFPMAVTQLCTVHLTRNILAKVKPTDKQEIANQMKEVLNPTNPKDTINDGYDRFIKFINKWIKKYPSFKTYLAPRYKLYFNYLNYHVEIRRMIYTTNWIERLNRNYKRTLRMRSAMPNPESVVFLLASVASRRSEYSKPIYQFIHEPQLFY
ncbi:MAG: IS256 family transposase [Pseudomonadota bacterium]